jgi:S23 ribosomal protein.
MGKFALDELRVYGMSEELADLVWDLVQGWDGFAKETVGKQMVRAGDSVGANIAEGCGRASRADNQRFVRIARGSLYELRHFLRRAEKRGLITREDKKPVALLMRELLPALNAYLKSLGDHGG